MLSVKRERARRALDQEIEPFRASSGKSAPPRGWLRAIRDALGMSGQQYADRLGIAWQSMADLEKSEQEGTVTVNTLRRAAAALDCHLVYAVVPNSSTLEATVARKARAIALNDLLGVNQTMTLENQAGSGSDLETKVKDYIAEHIRDSDLWANDGPRT